MNDSKQKTILFSPATYNLAETTRCIEVAKACAGSFETLFMSYGGEFEELIARNGFRLIQMEPRLTPEKIEHMYRIDQGRKFGHMFSVPEIEKQVENEIALFKEIKPAAVVTGFVFSNCVSCRAAKIPLVWLTQSTWMFDSYFKAGLGTYIDMVDLPGLRLLGERFLTWLSKKTLALVGGFVVKPYNAVARKYGIHTFDDMEQLWRGDYNLLAEPEGFCELDFPPSFRFIGPLPGRLDAPVPREIMDMPRDRPIVYFAMGSSGQAEVIAKILEDFGKTPYRVIAPVKSKLKNIAVKIPENVVVTGWLPALKVNSMADISVIHGGIGTVMTAALAGKPVVGVGMQPEQEFNIDCLARKGFAIRIRKNRLTFDALSKSIAALLSDKTARQKAKDYQKIVEQWNNPLLITRFFEETFGH